MRQVCLALFDIRETDPDLRARLSELVNRAQKAEQRRNALVHSVWTAPESPNDTSSIRLKFAVRKGKFHVIQEDVDASDINELGDEFGEIGKAIVAFMRDVSEHGSISLPEAPKDSNGG